MKKKISLLVLCGIVLLEVCGCGNKEETMGSRNNSKDDMLLKELKCSAFDDVSYGFVSYTNGDFYFITNNNDLYFLNKSQLFSNDENCKKINEDNIKILKQIDRDLVLGNDGNVYILHTDTLTKKVLDNPNVTYDDIVVDKGYILKTDGKIYTSDDKIYKELENEKIIDFGQLRDITFLKTDKAYYTPQATNEEQCKKYADVECKYEFVKNEKLTSLYDDIIIYNGDDMYLTKDGKLYSMEDND